MFSIEFIRRVLRPRKDSASTVVDRSVILHSSRRYYAHEHRSITTRPALQKRLKFIPKTDRDVEIEMKVGCRDPFEGPSCVQHVRGSGMRDHLLAEPPQRLWQRGEVRPTHRGGKPALFFNSDCFY